jgi:CubicO group peptidase (beta-lactamase class C family)
VAFFDLASLAKPLVTAPLALAHLDLDVDRRAELGFHDQAEPLTVRQLLAHASGLPPWRPYTGEPLAAQLRREGPLGVLPKLAAGPPGTSLYSDLGYRLLAELLAAAIGEPFQALGARASGLEPAPWAQAPPFAPQGADAQLWALAEPGLPMPPREPRLPNDANARAGMTGHAGFGVESTDMEACLGRWLASGAPRRMAVETAQGEDGSRWGLGLQRALQGPGRFGSILAALPLGAGGIHVHVQDSPALSPAAPALAEAPGAPSLFWFHLGYTGPALFYRPEDGLCLALLAHRLGPGGELLDAEAMRARRWLALTALVEELL